MNFVQPIRNPEKIEEMKIILIKNNYRDYFLFYFGINTGLRISDIIDLKVKDVLGRDHITLIEKKTKNTKKTKRFLINNDLKFEIKKYTQGMNDNDYLFPSQKGGHIKRVRAYEILTEAAEKVGITEIGTHTLRKTFGYHFYKQYKDIAMLQMIFGHSSASITLRYIGIEQDQIDGVLKDFSL
ncbi:phage integrase family protein [Alkalibaculum bacchi]|uniref:Phage integrase family protein n=1 Tax=Alkalibaculum bacchi TaxID=645887 RepID=A0A366HYT0_9FIRM|nr:tyrosine-type recombinase/integrase [Alkalibaculum bacchi]RBP59301.1 phage integrase family protein [Alkalibaculum bacchi]